MFEVSQVLPKTIQPAAPAYPGPERRRAESRDRHSLAAALDEIDYGMLLLTDQVCATHVNHAARAELEAERKAGIWTESVSGRRSVTPVKESGLGGADDE